MPPGDRVILDADAWGDLCEGSCIKLRLDTSEGFGVFLVLSKKKRKNSPFPMAPLPRPLGQLKKVN